MTVVPFKSTSTALKEIEDGLKNLSDLFQMDLYEIRSAASSHEEPDASSEKAEDLWSPKRDVYFEEGSYSERGAHMTFSHIDSFIDTYASVNPQDLRIISWKWIEGRGCGEGWQRPMGRPDTYIDGVLTVQMVNLGKARLCSAEVPVCRADAPAVREFLKAHARENARIWAGI